MKGQKGHTPIEALFKEGGHVALEQLRLHGADERLACGRVQVVLTPLILLRQPPLHKGRT